MGDNYGIFFMDSPDADYPHLQIRGVTSDGKFTGTMIESLVGEINQINLKGVFGKIDPKKNKAKFEWMQVYDPSPGGTTNPDWTMGFLGMSESGLTTSMLFEKFADVNNPPPASQILRWTHLFNSIGYDQYTDVHQNSQILPITEGHADWKTGLVTNINNSARCVGFFMNGDAFAFNTNNGKFDYKFFKNTAPFGSQITLWDIADNNYCVGIAKRFGGTEREIVIFQVTSAGDARFLKDEDAEVIPSAHVRGNQYYRDMYTGDVAISGLNEIAFIGQITGSGPGIVNYNFNTGQKRMMIEWTDDARWAEYENIRLTGMSSENAPNLVGYADRIADGKVVGFVAYPE